jgi:type III restriction enzyme
MKIELKDFQSDAVETLIEHLNSARYEASKSQSQAISVASPTGSGKTVIATSVIERILGGDDSHPADSDATFLWITDQPELNEQTRNKMLATSSVLTSRLLETINGRLDRNRSTFAPGKVYFLNTQKLGRNSNLVRPGDEGTFTLWQIIANTITERPTNFYVVIDEAHRGMQEGREREEANTIIQKFILGSEEIPEVPIIFAISATIERFDQVVARTKRVKRPVEVPIDEVRESGLLKDAIDLFHPDKKQPSDMTMLRAAARALKTFRDRWAAYAKQQQEHVVRPVLLVQVQDGRGKQISATNLSEVLSALSEELDHPPADAYAHAFQEGAPINVDATTVRYLAPSAIDADPDVQVVFFKTSLNTGWDCPRAETMMSFRTAQDDTSIAQLVGRMVRAPLARRITTDEHLNTVALYLPYYDRKGLDKVIRRLQADDPTNMPPTDVRDGRETVGLSRANNSAGAFDLLSSLPSYIIPRNKITSQVRRLGKLASLLARYGIDEDAPDSESQFLVGVLLAARNKHKNAPAFKAVVKDSGVLSVRAVQWRYDPDVLPEELIELTISDENVNDLFEWSGRKFGEGLHKAYWKARAAAGAKNHMTTKLEAYALATMHEVVSGLESKARARVQQLFAKDAAAIKKLPDGGRQAFNEVRGLAQEPEQINPVYPLEIEMAAGGDVFDKHLYVDPEGEFRFKTTTWELATLEEELRRKDIVGWLRNLDRKPWSLCVPYEMGKGYKGCYPDFLVVRKVRGHLVVDIVDPHLLTFEDAWHRAKGLARYAAKHADHFGRIEMIRVEDGRVDRIDLMDEAQRDRVLKVSTNDHLRELFDTPAG